MIRENDLPEGWVVKQFVECIEKEASSNKLKIQKNSFQNKGKYAIIDQSVKYIAGHTDDYSKIYNGDLPVIIFGDHTRIFKFVDFPFALGADGTKILVPKKEILLPKYFYYFLLGEKIENHGYSRHYKFLKEKRIVVPPLPTQKKIVAILEKAEGLKEWRKEADKLTDEFLKSTFLEMFGDPVTNPKGWEGTTLSEISKIDKNAISPENITAGTKYVGLEHIESNTGNIIGITSLNENELKSSKFLFTSEHVLYGKLRPYLNKVSMPYFDGVCSTDILPISPNKDKSNKYYLAFLLKHPYYVELATKCSTGANLPRISPKEFANFDVFCPPLPLQQKFASIVQQVEQLREHQSQSKQHIDDLFNVLMQKAFRGELEA